MMNCFSINLPTNYIPVGLSLFSLKLSHWHTGWKWEKERERGYTLSINGGGEDEWLMTSDCKWHWIYFQNFSFLSTFTHTQLAVDVEGKYSAAVDEHSVKIVIESLGTQSRAVEKKIRIRIRIIHMVPWPSPSREKIQSFVRFSTFCSLIELSSNMYFPIKLYFMYFYHHQLVVRWKLYSVWFFPPLYLPSSCVEMEWMNKLIKN